MGNFNIYICRSLDRCELLNPIGDFCNPVDSVFFRVDSTDFVCATVRCHVNAPPRLPRPIPIHGLDTIMPKADVLA